MFRELIIALFLQVFVCSTAAAAQEQLQGTIVIETRILPPDPVSGMKSTQRIRIFIDPNTNSMRFDNSYETGTTFGISAVRNKFELSNTSYSISAGTLSFDVIGQTASGVLIMPDIDYHFSVSFDGSDRQNNWRIDGCHDGYPAYRIWVENAISGESTDLYSFRHQPIHLLNLLGNCDTKVDINLNTQD